MSHRTCEHGPLTDDLLDELKVRSLDENEWPCLGFRDERGLVTSIDLYKPQNMNLLTAIDENGNKVFITGGKLLDVDDEGLLLNDGRFIQAVDLTVENEKRRGLDLYGGGFVHYGEHEWVQNKTPEKLSPITGTFAQERCRAGGEWDATVTINIYGGDMHGDIDGYAWVNGAVEELKDFDNVFGGWSFDDPRTKILKSEIVSIAKRDREIADDTPHALLIITVVYEHLETCIDID